jgi:WD40 repeat protein
MSTAFSLDGTKLALGSSSGEIVLWDVARNQQIGEPLQGHMGFVWSITFSPDGRKLASAGGDSTILWNVETQQQIGEPMLGPVWAPYQVAFSPDGKMLASGNRGDGTIILRDPETQRQIGEPIPGQDEYILGLAFSPDGKILAASSEAGNLILWDVDAHRQIGETIREAGWSVAFSPDSKVLASGSMLWDVATQQKIGGPFQGGGPLVFSHDGKMLTSTSASLDGIMLWDVATQQQIGEPIPVNGGQVQSESVTFNPDSTKLVSSVGTNMVTLWDMNPHLWLENSCQRAGRNFTRAEWQRYFPDEEYRRTCQQWPLEPEPALTPGPIP